MAAKRAWVYIPALVLAVAAISWITLATAVPGSQAAVSAAPHTITVTTTGDTNSCGTPCSLRGAIGTADSGDTIVIPAGTYTLALGSELVIAKNLTLTGDGADITIIQAATGEGLADSRVFNIVTGDVAISSVTIRHGNSTDEDGGGILNRGTLTLAISIVSNNSNSGGHIQARGGGIDNRGTLTVAKSTISGNTAGSGGIFNSGTVTLTNSIVSSNSAYDGGGLWNIGTADLTDTTISNNIATAGGVGIYNNGTLSLRNSAVIDNATTGGSFSKGGGIYAGGTVTITDSTINGNTASDGGGGIYNSGMLTVTSSTVNGNVVRGPRSPNFGGGIYNIGSLNMADSTVNGNTSRDAGGILNTGEITLNSSTVSSNTATGGAGGGIFNTGTVTLSNTTIRDNAAPAGNTGGGIFNCAPCGGPSATPVLKVLHSTISGNRSGFSVGINNTAGGTVYVNNSTISGNAALHDVGGIGNEGMITITSSTITGNLANNLSGGILNIGTADLASTIVAGNTAPNDPDCSGPATSLGHNLIGNDSGCSFTAVTGDLVNVDPLFGPLQDNSGPTFTHALLPGSPAIDHIPPQSCTVTTDQRGVARPQGSGCDIGAFEVVPGDANADGRVDGEDLLIVLAAYGTSPLSDRRADLNGDGLVDILDLVIVAINLGAGIV